MTEAMDLFGSMGLDDVEADPNFIPAGEYAAYITDSAIVTAKTGKNMGKNSWVLTYKVSDGKFNGRTQQEWFSLDPSNEQVKPWLKRRLLSIGVPESRIGSFNPADVVGTPVFVKIKHKDGYQNVADVKQRNENESVSNSSEDLLSQL